MTTAAAGFVLSGSTRIPLSNVWLLMLYAGYARFLSHQQLARAQENPDEIADLVAEVLCYEVSRRLRRNLTVSYRRRADALTRVRGRIDFRTTYTTRQLEQGRITCEFDEMTIDTPRNRFVAAALRQVARLSSKHEHACRSLARQMGVLGVGQRTPTLAELSTDRVGRHDTEDQRMIVAARFARDLALLSEADGDAGLVAPDRQVEWLRRLFEQAVAGYFKTVHGATWEVNATIFQWPIIAPSPGAVSLIGELQTDVTLEHRAKNRRIVIETKFADVFSEYRGVRRVNRNYMFQVYAYLQSQTGAGNEAADGAEGVLLFPQLADPVSEQLYLQGHRIRLLSVDLAGEPKCLRRELDGIVTDASDPQP